MNIVAEHDIEEVLRMLSCEGAELKDLYYKADRVRQDNCGDEIFLRGIIEFSNYCRKDCSYCGIRKSNQALHRYRIPEAEIVTACQQIAQREHGTVVLQSGEDLYYTKERLGSLIRQIKQESGLAITVSAGERDLDTYAYWQEQGMDRYLLRFETSNQKLFTNCHPDDDFNQRITCLKNLQQLGVQTGSGFLIGLPGETLQELAMDILFCTGLKLAMIGVGPFIPNPGTPLGELTNPFEKEVYFKTVAILRLLNPQAHIPSTTAFDAIQPNGRNLLLQRGANVFMPNATPQQYRKDYLLYPGKPCTDESSEDCAACVMLRIKKLGRQIGKGPGHSLLKKD
ncbi:[FeFe] hydrogenase H-cluster radical SAM maturase HydE [Candidatus Margulisiibacteriota bacterium]